MSHLPRDKIRKLSFFKLLNIKEIEEWQIEIKKKNNDTYELDQLIVYVAPKKNVDFIELKELLDRLGMKTELKEKRIIDTRPKT